MLKVELHAHTSDDPVDPIPYRATDLIDRASRLGFDALAITLHERQLDIQPLIPYARERGIVLIPGVERSIEGRHVLLLNFPAAAEAVQSFAGLARLKMHTQGLVVAVHPFYPTSTCLRGFMDRHADLFDAVELNAFYTKRLDFNRAAIRWARAHGKPLIANADVHRLEILGSSFSLVDADRDPDAICAAIRAGRVQVRTRPLSIFEALKYFASLAVADLRRKRVPVLKTSPSADIDARARERLT